MTLNKKLIVAFLLCGLLPLAAIAAAGYFTARHGLAQVKDRGAADLEQKAYNQLAAVREIKKRQIERQFHDSLENVNLLAGNSSVMDGMMA
ncbi:MAG TPA: hypothetical protein P5572_07590, partial [Phycisphaerae bacterium]|nr:hypothetical protein [Phycisphaerae bacterium]